MELPKGIKKIKILKGHLTHPVPPPLPRDRGQGRERGKS
jgi:hypothetical protein